MNDPRRAGRQPHHVARARGIILLSFAVAVLACLGLVLVVWVGLGQQPSTVLHDPSTKFGIPLYAGAVSTIGIWFLVAAGAVANFGALFPTPLRPVLGTAAVLCFIMALDDAFLLHEGIMRDTLGLPEELLPGIYAALACWILLSLRSRPEQDVRWAYITGLALLAGSLGVDIHGGTGLSVAEDLLKLLGYAAIGSSFMILTYRVLAERP